MSGNVAEWCYDVPLFSIDRNPSGASSSNKRVIRGGSWFSESSDCVVTHRVQETPNTKASDIGFRVVRSVPED